MQFRGQLKLEFRSATIRRLTRLLQIAMARDDWIYLKLELMNNVDSSDF